MAFRNTRNFFCPEEMECLKLFVDFFICSFLGAGLVIGFFVTVEAIFG